MIWPIKFELELKKTGSALAMRFSVHFIGF